MADPTESSDGDEQEFEILDGAADGYLPSRLAFHRMHGRGRNHRHGPPPAHHRAMGGPFGPEADYPSFGTEAGHPPPPPHWGPKAPEHPHSRHHHPYGPRHPHAHGPPPPPPMFGKGRGRNKSWALRSPTYHRDASGGNIYVFTRDFAPEELKVNLANRKLTVMAKRARPEADDTTEVCRESMSHVYRLPTDEHLDFTAMKAKLIQDGAFLNLRIPSKMVEIPIERDDEPISEMEVLDIAKD